MTATAESPEETHEKTHLEPPQYWAIALFLGVVTAIEVGATYIPGFEGGWLITALLVLGAVKFFTVIGWFMHLRYEAVSLNSLFYAGLVGAIILFLTVLLSFRALF